MSTANMPYQSEPQTAGVKEHHPAGHDDAQQKGAHVEGPVAKAIEEQTVKVPSDVFLAMALGSIGLSLGLQVSGKRELATFVGQWAPTILILGLYNKLVKLHGSDPAQSK